MAFFEATEDKLNFHRVFLDRGGIFSYGNPLTNEKTFFHDILDAANRHVQTLLRSYPIREKPSIYIDFIDNESIGAVLRKLDSIYYIGIKIGSVAVLQNFFNRAFSCPTVLTRYGDVSKEVQAYQVYNPNTHKIENLTSQAELVEGVTLKVIPIDEKRKGIACILTVFAINFLATHEIGHILNGHIDYLSSIGIYEWDESNDISVHLTDIDLIQGLEYDADCFAWNMMINAAFAYHQSPSSSFIGQPLLFICEDISELIGLMSFAMYTCFRLFGDNAPDDGNLLFGKHPHVLLRQAFMTGCIVSLLQYKVSLARINEENIYLIGAQMIRDIAEVEQTLLLSP